MTMRSPPEEMEEGERAVALSLAREAKQQVVSFLRSPFTVGGWEEVPYVSSSDVVVRRRMLPGEPFKNAQILATCSCPAPPLQVLGSLVDLNWQRLWDPSLEEGGQTDLDECTSLRTMKYSNVFGGESLTFRSIYHWSKEDDGCCAMTFVNLPGGKVVSAAELLPSGMLLSPSRTGCNVTLMIHLKANTQEYESGLAVGDAGIGLWVEKLMQASRNTVAALDVRFKEEKGSDTTVSPAGSGVSNQISFSFPGADSLDLSSDMRALPSFSNIEVSLPPVIASVEPRQLDVLLPPGVSASDYWPVAFEGSTTPTVVLSPAALDRLEYVSPSFVVHTNGEKSVYLHEGDRPLLRQLCIEVLSQKRRFFVHPFTFVTSSGLVLICEGNAAACVLAEGTFLVIELRPLLKKQLRAVSVIEPASELFAFESLFMHSPQPTALLASSGVVVIVNSAFATRFSAGPMTGEHVGKALPDIAKSLETLWELWFKEEQQGGGHKICGDAFVSTVSFKRGAGAFVASARYYLLSLVPEASTDGAASASKRIKL